MTTAAAQFLQTVQSNLTVIEAECMLKRFQKLQTVAVAADLALSIAVEKTSLSDEVAMALGLHYSYGLNLRVLKVHALIGSLRRNFSLVFLFFFLLRLPSQT